MATGQKDKNAAPPSDDEETGADASGPASEPEPEDREADQADRDEGEAEGDSELATAARDELAEGEGEGDDAAAQLGMDRYVLAAFFAGGMLLAYVLGRTVHGVWSALSNKDWFSRALPALAGVGDDDKTTWGTLIGAVIALVAVVRTYRNPEVRAWSDEVANELTKVKWPTKKEVSNSTIVVIAASAIATIYLMLLDRLWAFVTNLVYGGDGS
jgi:preprotein translocase subunit SecE